MQLQDQHVLVLGLGASGLAMARWCARLGAHVMVVDTRAAPPQLAALQAELPQVRFRHAPFSADLVDGSPVRAVFSSPGLRPDQTQATLAAARNAGLWVGGELSLFVQALHSLAQSQQYAPHVLAITGTNGKTTVTALTTHLVRWAGKTVAMAGNVGPTLLDTLAQALDAQALPEVWVLELSSFQLDLACGFAPSAATVLNVSQDHLDWHGSMAAYAQAKSRIFGTGLQVLNREDPQVMAMRVQPMAPRALGASGAKSQALPEQPWLSFGTDMPQRPGDFGLEEVNGMVWLVRALEADETQKRRRRGAAGAEQPEQALYFQRLMPADALRIRGRHNASNALASLALCAAAGCSLGPLLFGLREYRGEPHRVESIGVLNGIELFDDSKGTNVGATVAALKGLGQERKLLPILGGDGKGQDFSPLAEPVARYARAVLLIGRDALQIQAALADSHVPVHMAQSLPEAVQKAYALAQAGDAVLLSPACASFDMFENYEHRAQVFVQAAQALALEMGLELGLESGLAQGTEQGVGQSVELGSGQPASAGEQTPCA
jgi:UDP-N-acetylmuramoylalanine--D-glutamate ligase